MRRNSRAGFSLLEMLIAVSLASMVLLGVASISAQMVKNQVDGIRSGSVTGWTVVSYAAMVKEIEDANVLAFPIANGASADQTIICKNWSRAIGGALPGGKLDAVAPTIVTQFCVDPTAAPPGDSGFLLRRYSYTGNCPSPGVPAACTSAAPGAPWTTTAVVGYRIEKLAGFPTVFTRDNGIGGLRLRYVVGQQAATSVHPVPKFQTFNIPVSMTKNFSNVLD